MSAAVSYLSSFSSTITQKAEFFSLQRHLAAASGDPYIQSMMTGLLESRPTAAKVGGSMDYEKWRSHLDIESPSPSARISFKDAAHNYFAQLSALQHNR